ncbi:hypothetical protein VTL71DRAFT_10350 [Oculimacula yallundae]|uniref:ATP-grasp domain-containing protein n=1 Tax=Oculimacula yallundae TaxID=86028 RepID=A0ABR4CUB7_9HELO
MSGPQTPLVMLDITLSALYKKSLAGTKQTVFQVASFTDGLKAINMRYATHQEEIFDTTNDTAGMVEQRKRAYLSEGLMRRAIGAQSLAFCAGSGLMIAFPSTESDESYSSTARRFKASLEDSLKSLDASQRPSLSFMAQRELPTMAKQIGKNGLLALHVAIDGIPEKKCLISPDLHYQLMSKRKLASSGLQTPRCEIIDLGTDAEIEKRKSDAEDISQNQDYLLDAAIITRFRDDVTRAVRSRNGRFVMKLQQTAGGVGSSIVRSGNDQAKLLARLPIILDYILGQTNVENLELRPSSIIISDFVTSNQDPPTGHAISIFVHRNLAPDFFCCATENMSDNDVWEGASIDYTQQIQLQAQFQPRINEVSQYLQDKGYFGPVGIDIMVDTTGKQWIVDLNVRAPESMVLGLLQGHLWKNGQVEGFRFAKLISVLETNKTKAEFLEEFKVLLQHGSIVLFAWWSENEDGLGKNFASLVLAGNQGILRSSGQCHHENSTDRESMFKFILTQEALFSVLISLFGHNIKEGNGSRR